MTQRPIDAIEMPADRSSKPRSTSTARTFIIAAYALLTAGWAANHFSTMLAVLRDQAEFSPVVVNGAFGIYALGLVPSLLMGGLLADRIGPGMLCPPAR